MKNGPLRDEIERQGGLKLIYIDPPFDVGADFSMDIEIGEDTFTKKPNILEEIAYRDTWGKGADSFIAMIYERLVFAVRQKVPASQVDRTLYGLTWHEKFRLFSGNFASDSEH